jgi:hypothetical protein
MYSPTSGCFLMIYEILNDAGEVIASAPVHLRREVGSLIFSNPERWTAIADMAKFEPAQHFKSRLVCPETKQAMPLESCVMTVEMALSHGSDLHCAPGCIRYATKRTLETSCVTGPTV